MAKYLELKQINQSINPQSINQSISELWPAASEQFHSQAWHKISLQRKPSTSPKCFCISLSSSESDKKMKLKIKMTRPIVSVPSNMIELFCFSEEFTISHTRRSRQIL